MYSFGEEDFMKPKVAIIRGKFLNAYEMQSYEPLVHRYALTAFGSLTSYHDRFAFPVIKLPSPMDLPEFPFKMQILNRLIVDAQYLLGLEHRLKGFNLVHTAETYYHYTQQCLDAKQNGYVKKVITTVLENIPFNNEGIWGRKKFKRRAREELDHIIVLTSLTREALIMEGCEPSKITVIGHGVDTKRFKPKKKRGIAMNILFVGRLEEYKGIFDVISAACLLLKDPKLKRHPVIFILVGDGSLREKVIAFEKSLGIDRHCIHKQVSYEKMPEVYQAADIFVAPSKPRTVLVRGKETATWQEQYSTVLLEAQACGLPIVTTRTGGIPENVGDAALVVAPGSVDGIARSIRRYILDAKLRRLYAAKARQRALIVHDSRIVANKISNVYQRVLAS